MNGKIKVVVLAAFFFLTVSVYGQEERPSVDDILAKMKIQTNLTQQQADAIRPILEESMAERQQLMQSLKNQGVTDKSTMQSKMDQLRGYENQKLSQILTKDQMDKWNSYQNFQKMLDQDQMSDTKNQMGRGHKHGRHGGRGWSSESGE